MSYDPERITFFAETDARGQKVPFGIKAKDRTRHVYVIGKTGMGKSTLLENMAVQDMRNGEGLAFIDPHGQTAETLLNYVPEDRVKDVLYFAPFDMGHPISFNVMEDVGPERRHLVVSGLMSVFKKIWVDAWSARMEYILQNTLLALLEYPDSTLLGVNRMLSDKEYRARVIDNISDPAVKSFWVDEFLKYNERYMQEAGDAIKNKVGQFTANPLIRNIIGQPKSTFDMRQIMDERKILIMNLSKGLVGETNANLLGSMLTTRIYLAAMSRADLPVEKLQKMPNFYFYVDEFQSFANATFANILSEARKYKLNLTIAHQYIEQMEEEVRNAVFGNVGTIISFRVGPFDAEVLEQVFTPQFLAPDIVNLGFAQVYLTLMIDGIGSPPFSATTLPPIEPAQTSCKDMIIASSRKQFGHDRAVVEQNIIDWHAPIVPERKAPNRPAAERENNSNGNGNRNGNGGGADARSTNGGGNNGNRFERPSGNGSNRSGNGNGNSSARPTGGNGGTNENNGPRSREVNDDRANARSDARERNNHVQRDEGRRSDERRSSNDAPRQHNGEQSSRTPTRDRDRGNDYNRRDNSMQPTESKRQPDLSDLRAVLQKISGNGEESKKSVAESKKEEKPVPTSSHQNERNDSFDKNKSAPTGSPLRSALAEVLKQTQSSQSAPKDERKSAEPQLTNEVPRVNVASPEPAVATPPKEPATVPTSTTETKPTTPKSQPLQSSPASTKTESVDNPLSPKKLERMMRITGNDRSPFK